MVINCKHNLCRECIDSIQQQADNVKKTTDEDNQKAKYKCPIEFC